MISRRLRAMETSYMDALLEEKTQGFFGCFPVDLLDGKPGVDQHIFSRGGFLGQ
jgi:hypothetical protein